MKQIDKADRREFLIRSAKAATAVTLTGALAYYLYDEKGPQSFSDSSSNIISSNDKVTIPDFSIKDTKKICIVRGKKRKKAVRKGIKALGGIEKFISGGDNVLLKVNAAFATPPILSATTSPELILEVINLCFQAGANNVAVTDNPINDPQSCFALTGIKTAVEKTKARLILPNSSFFKSTTLKGGKLIKNWPILFEPLNNINKLIGISPVKHHQRSGASLSMKNWYGLLGGNRNIFHQNINDIIKELGMLVKPTLVILDGTVTMMRNGPTGGSLSDLKQTNTMIISTDQVAADAYAVSLLEKEVSNFPFLYKAQKENVGTYDYKSLNPVYVNA